MKGPDITACYAEILATSRLMLEAAKKGEWDELIALEGRRDAQVAQLQTFDLSLDADDLLRERQLALIKQILDCDLETKSLVERWQGEIRIILNSVGTERKLKDAYMDSV
jgi:flagellar protein FliT